MTLEMFFTRLSKYSSICRCVTVEFIISNNMGLKADSKSVRKLLPFIELMLRQKYLASELVLLRLEWVIDTKIEE